MRRTSAIVLGAIFVTATWLQQTVLPGLAETIIYTEAEVQADDKSVRGILDTFRRAETFLQAGNLDGLMGLYSDQYTHYGFTKSDLRKIWADLLAEHPKMATHHLFSKIIVTPGTPPTAEVTCTGSLWADLGVAGQRVTITSWYQEVHYMVYEQGEWRIRGNAGEPTKEPHFGKAPHPFF